MTVMLGTPRPMVVESEVRVTESTARLRLGVLDMQAGSGSARKGRCSGSYIESGNLERNETPSRGSGERCR